MGVKDDFAFDQPAISIELFADGGGGSSLGPDGGGFFGLINRFLLDTGATSIIAMNDAESNLRSNGYLTENTVFEQGVAGFSELDVSASYIVELTDEGGATYSIGSTRIMSGQFPDLFGVNGVVGMPGMVGRVVSIDETVWKDINDIFDIVPLDVRVSSALPAGGGHRYSVPVKAKRFDVEGEPPLPASSPIPLLNMSVGYSGLNASGTFALDTGAAISFISTKIAGQIGLDSNGDGELGSGDEQYEGTLPIGGIGGTIDAPLFLIDRFSVPTEQGVDLVWNLEGLLSVLVVDIHPDLDGVLGADLLTSGWFNLEDIFGGGGEESTPGPVEHVHFDFREFFEDNDTGTVYFDLTPDFDVVQGDAFPGDFNNDGAVDNSDLTLLLSNWGASVPPTPAGWLGTPPTAGAVDNDELTHLLNQWGKAIGGGAAFSPSSAVPEPSASALALAASLAALLLRRSQSCSLLFCPLGTECRRAAKRLAASKSWQY